MFHDLDPAAARKWKAGLYGVSGINDNVNSRCVRCAFVHVFGFGVRFNVTEEILGNNSVDARAEEGSEFIIYRYPAGHSPYLSWTKGVVVGIVLGFVRKLFFELSGLHVLDS